MPAKKGIKPETVEKVKRMYPQYDFSESIFTDRQSKIKYKCPAHGIISQTPKELLEGHKCWYCGVEERDRNRIANKAKETMSKLKEKYPDFEFGEYKGALEKIEFICPEHGIQHVRPNDMLNGHGCPDCGISRRNDGRRLTLEIIKQRSLDYHGDVWDFSEAKEPNGECDSIDVRCKICGRLNHKPVLRVMYGKCNFCDSSQGEQMLWIKLEELGVNFIPEYSFDDCRFINPLPFDFYLPDYNTVIEFQGGQHDSFTRFFHESIDDLKFQQMKDDIKRKYCIEKGIREIELRTFEEVKKLDLALLEVA